MMSEMVNAIDWLSPPTLIDSTPWVPRVQYKSVLPLPGIDPATFSMRVNHLAYAATQEGIDELWLLG